MTRSAACPVPETGFNPASAEVLRDPYPSYAWLLRNDPLHRGFGGLWFVSRYADVRAVLNDERFRRDGIRALWTGLVGAGPLGEIIRHTVLFQDEPDHSRLRGLVAAPFTARAARTHDAAITRLVEDLLKPVARRGHLDVITDFAYPLALGVIMSVLGLPAEDRDQIRSWSLAIGPTLDLVADADEIRRGQEAMGELVDYLGKLAAGGHVAGDSLLGVMLAHRDQDISTEEIQAMVLTLIFAGHETVTNQIGNGVLALIHHPDQLALLRARPELAPQAVEELLRYDTSVQSNSRQLDQDVELGGQQLRRGELVVILAGAANRDPAQFTDPDRLDITRTDVHPMSFGSGMRFCLGAYLARLELTAAFRGLAGLPDIRLAVPEQELVYQRSTMFRGLLSLPVDCTSAGGR
jgi:cytochrome P450